MCIKSGLIVLFRREEWFKVFIHECLHSFGMEFSGMNLNRLNIELKEREGPSNGSIRAKVMVF